MFTFQVNKKDGSYSVIRAASMEAAIEMVKNDRSVSNIKRLPPVYAEGCEFVK